MTIHKTPPTSGTPIWLDYMTRDSRGTSQFFEELLGWEIPPGDPEMGNYATAELNGRFVTGIAPAMGQGSQDVQSVYLATTNIEQTVRRAIELGGDPMQLGGPQNQQGQTSQQGAGGGNPSQQGKQTQQGDHQSARDNQQPTSGDQSRGGDGQQQIQDCIMQVGDQGRMAVITDPTGAVFGLWQPEKMIGFEVTDEPGAPCWFELITQNPQQATQFYTELFDLQTSETNDPDYQEIQNRKGVKLFGIMRTPEAVPAEVGSYWQGYYQVDDIEKTTKKVQKLNGSVIIGPNDIPEGKWLNATTPGGAVVGLFAPVKRTTPTPADLASTRR